MDSSRIGLLGTGCVVMILAAGSGMQLELELWCPGRRGLQQQQRQWGGWKRQRRQHGRQGHRSKPSDCPKTYPLSVGTLVTVAVSWPATGGRREGTGQAYIWLLTTYRADSSNKITGTTTHLRQRARGPHAVRDLGDWRRGVPDGQTGQVEPEFPRHSWDGVPPTAITGTLGGTNDGQLVPGRPVGDALRPRRRRSADRPDDEVADVVLGPHRERPHLRRRRRVRDGQGHPGIRGVFDRHASVLPLETSLRRTSPAADSSGASTRTSSALYGTSTSCTETSGTAYVTLINNRVVGCEIATAAARARRTSTASSTRTPRSTCPATGTFTRRSSRPAGTLRRRAHGAPRSPM